MNTTASTTTADAGRAGWTRDLARDLFPGSVTPFAHTLLAGPAERALRNAYNELGGQAAPRPFWHLGGGYVYLDASAIAEADQSLCGAGWLGVSQPQAPGGLRGRLQAGGVAKRCHARVAAAATEASGLQTRLSRWLAWVHGVKWTQADLLQVMEELEPHALAALQTYFLLRVGLNASWAAFEARMPEWQAVLPAGQVLELTLGVPDLPSVAMTEAIFDAARRPATDPQRLATLARCSHRGPGEIRPDASRWPDASDLLSSLASQGQPVWSAAGAAARQRQALTNFERALPTSRFRETEELLRNLAAAMRAADIAWDALTLVMAASQRWVNAAARETLAADLISHPADVLYLELEELKQVATGEWHAGDSDRVRAAVEERMRVAAVPLAPEAAQVPFTVCPGQCEGSLYRVTPSKALPEAGAAWLAETADPGCAPFWGFAGCVHTSGADPLSPGMVVARGIGVPAVVGVSAA